jgi:hypothetical protein
MFRPTTMSARILRILEMALSNQLLSSEEGYNLLATARTSNPFLQIHQQGQSARAGEDK